MNHDPIEIVICKTRDTLPQVLRDLYDARDRRHKAFKMRQLYRAREKLLKAASDIDATFIIVGSRDGRQRKRAAG
jgi:hypothetical protein